MTDTFSPVVASHAPTQSPHGHKCSKCSVLSCLSQQSSTLQLSLLEWRVGLAGAAFDDHLVDLSQPAAWYPAARSLQRTVVAHLGPPNSGARALSALNKGWFESITKRHRRGIRGSLWENIMLFIIQ